MAAAAAIAAAAAQKDMVWCKCGKIAKKPKLTDPLQLYSLGEVQSSEGTGPDAVLSIKIVDSFYNKPMDFLPQGGGFSEGEVITLARKETYAANPPHQALEKDLGSLDNLHEPALLYCMGQRYYGQEIEAKGVTSWYCTNIGTICCAINPFSPGGGVWKNTYVQEDYVNSKEPVALNKKLQPHPWAVGDMAYREMLEEGNNQAVLICGESGAGKTECCKFVLAFLIAKKESTVENLAEKLMDTNDPLEAFGNAKTVNNDNSSRFAKCMQICIDKDGRVVGSEIQTSLLEKGRSCAFFQQERNFHIFYMLCYYKHEKCSSDPGEDQNTDTSDAVDMLGEKAHKYLKHAKDYNFVRPGAIEVDTEGQLYSERFRASDIDWFKRVIKSFRVSLGYTKQETDDMMSLLTGVLHMGEIEFTDEDAAKVTDGTRPDLVIVADLFGMDAAEFEAEIVLERIMMGGSLIDKTLNKIKAMGSRDAICKSVFQTIFTDIVERCNVSVAGDKEKAKGRVGVLDIFGFERMQFNSLEQICINYTNEKLHQTFINEVFESEKKVYRDEGLDPGAIQFTDNAKVLEMTTGCNPHDISGKTGATQAEIKKKMKISLFGILDDVCKQEKNTGVTYCERVMKQWTGAEDANGPLFEKPKFGAEEFSVVHFAGPVKYGTTEVDKVKFLPPSQWAKAGIDPTCPQIDSFLTKNKDKVPQSLLDFFAEKATNGYYQYITRPDREGTVAGSASGAGATGASAAKTIVSKFNLEIEAFFKQLLTGANPKFIRAINPRPKGIPAPKTMGQRFNLQRVLNQLRYTGILDTVRVRASGYIIRKRYEDFAPGYIHPCNMLPEGNALQGDMDDLAFADKVKEDADLAKEVIRMLFGNADYAVPKEEVLEGKTMIFIKKLTTIALLNKAKEDLMAEVIKREMAKINMTALALKVLRTDVSKISGERSRRAATVPDNLKAQMDAAATIHRFWKGYVVFKKFKNIWYEYKTFGKAKPIGEAYAIGFLVRKAGFGGKESFAVKKARAIDEGLFEAGGSSLIKRKKKKPSKAAAPVDFTKFAEAAAKSQTPEQKKAVEKAQKARAEAVEAVKAAAVAAGKSPAEAEAAAAAVPPPKIVTPATLGAALGAGQAAAAEAAPTTENPEHLKMRTKDFLNRSLMTDLQKALARMQEDRPTDVQAYLAAVLNGEEPPKVHVKDEEGSIYTYLKNNGIFGLLRPALLCCDRDRPKDPKKYIAAFMAGAVDSL
jgi:myosin heavy subunit